MTRVLIVTDTWKPQVNGVVRVLAKIAENLFGLGYEVGIVSPAAFSGFPCPSYPEIKLATIWPSRLRETIERHNPDTIHIATEGPLGLLTRNYCVQRGLPFSTAFHTRFPEYLRARWPIPVSLSYRWLRWFHSRSESVLVASDSMVRILRRKGFSRLKRWTLGVDHGVFRPRERTFGVHRCPLYLYVGRIAIEKNVCAFLNLEVPGAKILAGNGPELPRLRQRYPEVHFTGLLSDHSLARLYAAADVLVFPSRTDTFGLVILEALASGLPVAAYPVPGPLDLLSGANVGSLHKDLAIAVESALKISSDECRSFAENFPWRSSAQQFADCLEPISQVG